MAKVKASDLAHAALDSLLKVLGLRGFYGEGTITIKSQDGSVQKDIEWTATKRTYSRIPESYESGDDDKEKKPDV